MPFTELRPNDRYALVGKTRSGKTSLGMVMAGTMAESLLPPWEVWWLDTKGDPKDIAALREWGFRNAASQRDRTETGGLSNAIYWLIRDKTPAGEDISVVDQAQAIIRQAYARKFVVIVVDEYATVVLSSRTAGTDLLNVFQRGGGRNVGLIGLTQEPVFIPRQLISQSTHLILLTLTYGEDIKYVRKFNPEYVPPSDRGDKYGFYWLWVDGPGRQWHYYRNQKEWHQTLQIAQPAPPAQVSTSSDLP